MDKIFACMDRDKNAEITYDEFIEGSKQDPMIMQVRGIGCSSYSLTTFNIGPELVQLYGGRKPTAGFEVQSLVSPLHAPN